MKVVTYTGILSGSSAPPSLTTLSLPPHPSPSLPAPSGVWGDSGTRDPDRMSSSCATVSLCCILLRMRSDSRSFSYTVCGFEGEERGDEEGGG